MNEAIVTMKDGDRFCGVIAEVNLNRGPLFGECTFSILIDGHEYEYNMAEVSSVITKNDGEDNTDKDMLIVWRKKYVGGTIKWV